MFLLSFIATILLVSILVLVDFVRNGRILSLERCLGLSFNPCFSGFCSECLRAGNWPADTLLVSILVLVDFVRNEALG